MKQLKLKNFTEFEPNRLFRTEHPCVTLTGAGLGLNGRLVVKEKLDKMTSAVIEYNAQKQTLRICLFQKNAASLSATIVQLRSYGRSKTISAAGVRKFTAIDLEKYRGHYRVRRVKSQKSGTMLVVDLRNGQLFD